MAAFYLDHDVAVHLADLLRAAGHTVTTARELHTQRASDDTHVLLAASHGWVFVTHNVDDFLLLHGAWRRWTRAWGISPVPQHEGILIMPQGDADLNSRALLNVLESGLPLTNELYTWKRDSGWVHVPPPD